MYASPSPAPPQAELRLGRTMGSFLLVFDKLEVITRPVSRQRFPCIAAHSAQSHPDPRNGSHYWAAHQTPFNQTCERRLTMLYNAHAQATFSSNNITNMHRLYSSENPSLTCMILFAKIQLSVRISEDQRFLQG